MISDVIIGIVQLTNDKVMEENEAKFNPYTAPPLTATRSLKKSTGAVSHEQCYLSKI